MSFVRRGRANEDGRFVVLSSDDDESGGLFGDPAAPVRLRRGSRPERVDDSGLGPESAAEAELMRRAIAASEEEARAELALAQALALSASEAAATGGAPAAKDAGPSKVLARRKPHPSTAAAAAHDDDDDEDEQIALALRLSREPSTVAPSLPLVLPPPDSHGPSPMAVDGNPDGNRDDDGGDDDDELFDEDYLRALALSLATGSPKPSPVARRGHGTVHAAPRAGSGGAAATATSGTSSTSSKQRSGSAVPRVDAAPRHGSRSSSSSSAASRPTRTPLVPVLSEEQQLASVLEASRRSSEAEQRRGMVAEQEREFEEALAKDRAKDAEAAAAARAEEERRRAEQEAEEEARLLEAGVKMSFEMHQASVEQRHAALKAQFAALPEPAAGVAGTTSIAVRLPSGQRPARRWLATDRLQLLHNWTLLQLLDELLARPPPAPPVDGEPAAVLEVPRFSLVNPAPPVVRLVDLDASLADAGLVPRALVSVAME